MEMYEFIFFIAAIVLTLGLGFLLFNFIKKNSK